MVALPPMLGSGRVLRELSSETGLLRIGRFFVTERDLLSIKEAPNE